MWSFKHFTSNFLRSNYPEERSERPRARCRLLPHPAAAKHAKRAACHHAALHDAHLTGNFLPAACVLINGNSWTCLGTLAVTHPTTEKVRGLIIFGMCVFPLNIEWPGHSHKDIKVHPVLRLIMHLKLFTEGQKHLKKKNLYGLVSYAEIMCLYLTEGSTGCPLTEQQQHWVHVLHMIRAYCALQHIPTAFTFFYPLWDASKRGKLRHASLVNMRLSQTP